MFIQHALEIFKQLNWRPANPKDLSREDLIVYGNLDATGRGTVCVIDPAAKLFKVELEYRTETTVLSCKVIKKYEEDTNASHLLDECLDAVGGLYGDLCVKVGAK